MTFLEFYDRAVSCYKNDNLNESTILIDAAIKIDNTNYRGPLLKAHIEKKRGNYTESLSHYDEAIALCKKTEIKQKLELQKESIKTYNNKKTSEPPEKKIKAKFPSNPSNNYKKYFIFGESVFLITIFIIIFLFNSPSCNDTNQCIIIGDDLFQKGKFEDSIKYYNRALNFEPTNISAFLHKNAAFINLNQLEEMYSSYKEFLATYPQNGKNLSDILRTMALLESNLGYQERSLQTIENALLINSTSFDVLNIKGKILSRNNRYQESMDVFNQSLSLDPNYAPTWDGIGALMFSQSRYDQASIAYDKALSFNPLDSEALDGKNQIKSKQTKDKLDIEEILMEYRNAFNSNNFKEISSLFSSNSYYIENGELKIMSQNILQGVSMRLKIDEIKIKNISIYDNNATIKIDIIYLSGGFKAPKDEEINMVYENGKWSLTNSFWVM